MIRRCSPSDIIRGASRPSRHSHSKVSIAYSSQWRGVNAGSVHIFMSLESRAYGRTRIGWRSSQNGASSE